MTGSQSLLTSGYLSSSVTSNPVSQGAAFASRPFTPPEYDDGSYSYTWDVFSFSAVVLNCLTDVKLDDYKDISKALKELDAPDEVIEVIKQAVSLDDPAKRQPNAEILLAELNAIQRQREK